MVSAQNGGLVDFSFSPIIESAYQTSVFAITEQSDGKILVGGHFSLANDRSSYNLARFNSDGTLDASFKAAIPVYPPGVRAIAVQSDGKILIGGYLLDPLTQELRNIVRLNSDGSFDQTFTAKTNSIVNVIVIQPDNKIVIAGNFLTVNGQTRPRIVRLNTDGSTDSSFGYGAFTVDAVVLQPDGKIVLSEVFSNASTTSTYKVSRLNANGSLDGSFAVATATGNGFRVRNLKMQPDGKILVGGSFTQINNSSRTSLARLNGNGSVDETFNPNLTATTGGSLSVNTIDVDANSRILIGGNFASVNGTERNRIARLNSDGTTDVSFANQIGSDDIIYAIVSDTDGKIFIGGDFRKYGGEINYRFIKLNSDGSVDSSFPSKINSNGYIYDIEIQPDGKILAAGTFFYVNGTSYGSIVRLMPDGTPDPTFANYEKAQFGGELIEDMELQPDGKILIVGGLYFRNNTRPFAVARLNADGTVDNTFTPVYLDDQPPKVVKVQPNGQILVAGRFTRIDGFPKTNIVRLNSNGNIDNSFNPLISATTPSAIRNLAIRNDGKILIGGYFSLVNETAKNNIALLNADGTLDNSFTANTSGNFSASITSFKQLVDGNFLVAGFFSSINGTPRNRVAKLNSNGQIDSSFNVDSTLTFPINKIETFNDGRIILAGDGSNKLVVLNSDGSSNASLPSNLGPNDAIFDLAVQSDGRILIGGQFTTVNNTPKYGLARLNGIDSFTKKTLFDFDGDGKADVSVFRPSERVWYIQNSSNNSYNIQQFGLSDDLIVPADFDGDGKTDIAVFRPSNGVWYWLNSSNNNFSAVKFGMAGDVPVPADYDGDGKADLAVFRPSEGVWYRLFSSNNQFSAVAFGLSEDKPTVGDFDGDGKSDIAVWRPSNGVWYRLNSSNNSFAALNFGLAGDKPTAADFDGDGKTDIAVYRPENGVWYYLKSSDGSFNSVAFGLPEDKPAAADYDGDGKADISVFRPSNGIWYFLRSTQGFSAYEFGKNGDLPSANAFSR